MAVKDKGDGRFDVYLRGEYVKRVHDPKVARMEEQRGKRLLELGQPLAEVKRELKGSASSGPTFGSYRKRWFAEFAFDSEGTRRAYRGHLERSRSLDALPLIEVDAAALKRLTATLKRQGYAAATVKSTLTCVKSLLHDAYDEGLVNSQPTAKVKGMPKPQAVRPGWALTRAEHAAICDAAAPRAREMFALWPWVGLRLGEMLALEWGDIDLDARRIHVQRQRHINGSVTLPKGRKKRYVDISEPAFQILSGMQPVTAVVFPGHRAGHIGRHTVYKWAHDARDGFHPHIFRHTFGSWLIYAGAPLTYVAAQMGDTIETLTRVYAHDLQDADKRGIMALNKWAEGDGVVTGDSTS